MNELKPCPFCGGEAMKMTSSDGFTSIGCLECNPVFGVMVQAMTEAEAIKAWNTRAERTCKAYMHSGFLKDEPNAIEFSCGHFCLWPDEIPPKYCPDCGAKVVSE